MVAPTVDELQSLSAFLAGRDDAELASLSLEGSALVSSLTSRDIGVIAAGAGENPLGCEWVDVPGYQQPLAKRAVAMMVESLVGGTSSTTATTRGDRLLASFSAGPYSESYFSPEQVAKSQTLHPDPTLASILWSLATECARRYWMRMWGIEGGVLADGIAVQTVPRMGWRDRPRY